MRQSDTNFYGKDLTGTRVGKLTVTGYHHRTPYGAKKWKYYWTCKCDCGNECIVEAERLRDKVRPTRSCGCLNRVYHNVPYTWKKTEISDRAKQWIINHYGHTKNADIMEKYGIKFSWLHRFAREHGLKKTARFMAKCQKATTDAAKASHLKNGTYPPKGYRIPGADVNGFKPGHTDKNERAKRARISKAAASRKETWEMEKIRAKWGLDRKTKLRVTKQAKNVVCLRSNLRKRGYHIERGSNVAYYDENTRRAPQIEARRKGDKNYVYFEFLPL